MTARKFFASVSAAAMVAAPLAAQAGTRAESSPVAVDVQRGSADVAGQSEMAGFNLVWLLLLLAVIAAIVAASGGGGDRSRG